VALDEKKRQKKLARKTAKRKAKQASVRDAYSSSGSAERDIASALNSPVHECLVPEGLFDAGIGNVLIGRKMPDGKVALCVFLLDVFCLGIKDAFLLVMSNHEYAGKMVEIRSGADFRSVEPPFARKLVESAGEYAEDLGFGPHPKYLAAKKIFGDIDPQECQASFEFGKDGRPLFISGPNDTQAKCMKIIETLTRRCGPGGFQYMIGVNQGI
jgi:hypothetical protein